MVIADAVEGCQPLVRKPACLGEDGVGVLRGKLARGAGGTGLLEPGDAFQGKGDLGDGSGVGHGASFGGRGAAVVACSAAPNA